MDSILVGVTNLSLPQLSIFTIAFAVCAHFTFFSRSELDSYVKIFFSSFFIAPITIFSTFYLYLHQTLTKSLELTGTLFGSFLLGLSISILVYRIWLHPLRHFPGPFWAKTSKWWFVYTQWRTGLRFHQYCRELHEKYGDFVRTGPNDLSIINPNILPILSKAKKGPWYEGSPQSSLHTTRNKNTHSVRRRVWEKAFTVKALQDYTPRITNYTNLLMSNIAENTGKPMNMTDWFAFLSFDFMGDLAFGKSFGLLESKGKNGSDRHVRSMHASMVVVGMLGHVSWFIRLIQWIPGMSRAQEEFIAWCGEMVNKRKQYTPEKNDIFHFLLEAEPRNTGPHHVDLVGDAQLAIVAGSDTTAATFINIFAQLANNPQAHQKLQDEIDAVYQCPYDSNQDQEVPQVILQGGTTATRYLDAVINEGLRLNPAIPSGVQRVIPAGGVTVEGTYIPGGTYANYPIFAGQSNRKTFKDPLKFVPERWIEYDEQTKEKQRAAFSPFWIGTYACAGKSLALLELRMVIARILRKYNVEPAEGITIERIYDNSFDTFTLMMGPLELIFSPRGS